MNENRFKIDGVEACAVTSQIEFDPPALRAVLNYGSTETDVDALYYQVGAGSMYSFGIDVDRGSRYIVLVELRLYGSNIFPWSNQYSDAEEIYGCPKVNTGIWSNGSVIDVNEDFKLQSDGEQIRVQLYDAKVDYKYCLGSHIILEADNCGHVCGVIFLNIDESIIEYLIKRYGQ